MILRISWQDIQKLIVAHATSGDIMRVARMKGTVTMRQDGALKALSGITSLEEVNRVASEIKKKIPPLKN